ncbi:MAG: nucleotide pyrophosphohydrolase [Candidatus Altiarchaeales archaeon]|nr:nucleotide pyrophosphohydrolase [Candidatus Altiarchaeales archaeon]
MAKKSKTTLEDLVGLMAHMRSERGCPWDRKQKFKDFLKHLKDESDEVLQAIKKEDYENLREELGDLLWNIVFLCQMAKEQKRFDIYDVMSEVKDKIVRRHPHVFGKVKANTPEEVMVHYRRVKNKEKLLPSKRKK